MSNPQTKFEAIRKACSRLKHGTRGRYMSGCRCLLCRAANSNYSCAAQRRHDRGENGNIVDAGRAREHLLILAKSGVGRRSVSEACDVSATILHAIKLGRRIHIRATTERKILSVDLGAARGKCLVSAAATWRLLDELIGRGFSRAQLAKWLGYQSPALQFKRGGDAKITAATAARVEKMYRLLDSGKLRRPI